MSPRTVEVFSIGHSNLSYRGFASRLRKWDIQCVLDVRTVPYSKFVPHFNYDVFQGKLAKSNLGYEYLGNQLGSYNSRMRNCSESLADYRRQIACEAFEDGIDRVLELAQNERVVIMCAEGNPYGCHRHTVLASALAKRGVSMQHLLKSGIARSAFAAPVRSDESTGWVQRDLFDESPSDEGSSIALSSNDALPRVA